jgi:hypothetical protein
VQKESIMTLVLDMPENLVEELRHQASSLGQSVESLVETWLKAERNRQAAFDRVDQIRQTMFEKYGTQPDSVPLIREDRDR